MQLAQHTRTAVIMLLLLTALTGVVYPLLMTGISPVLFPYQANGSLVRDSGGTIVGSELIGQNFSDPRYFHSRPSAAGTAGYDASSSSGSNLGPTSKSLADSVADRVAMYRQENGLPANTPVPVDAVTASASGLDPHIIPANARLQVGRVARERGLSEDQVRRLVDPYTEGRTLGFIGEPRVNVLKLNRTLDGAR
jgi:K+-transporting ATPase ATPase C chain